MSIINARLAIPLSLLGGLFALPAAAEIPFSFSTGDLDGFIGTASRPDTAFGSEIESADDFILTQSTSIAGATFTGLLTGSLPLSSIGEVVVEIYRVFPKDSDVGRTSGPPTFSTSQVPTRVNSPSDVALDERDSTSGLTFSTTDLGAFVTGNSVQPGGIHSIPGQTTGGNGALTGQAVEFNVTFTTPFALPADHYFFVPQVEMTNGDGAFFWLSAPKPIVAPGTPFAPDLQSWTRDAALDPDWLRVGTDIVGAGAFNATFSLSGSVIPEPSTWAMALIGFAGLGFAGWRRARQARSAIG